MPAGVDSQCDDSLPTGGDDPVEFRNGTPSSGRHSCNVQRLTAEIPHNEIVRYDLPLIDFVEIKDRILDHHFGGWVRLPGAWRGHERQTKTEQQCDKLWLHKRTLPQGVEAEPRSS